MADTAEPVTPAVEKHGGDDSSDDEINPDDLHVVQDPAAIEANQKKAKKGGFFDLFSRIKHTSEGKTMKKDKKEKKEKKEKKKKERKSKE